MNPVPRKGGPPLPADTFAILSGVNAPPQLTFRLALKAFRRVADHWSLGRNDRATLLAASARAIVRWERDASSARLHRDQLERISYILGIFAGLHSILGDSPFADEWVRSPNLDFGGRSPLDRMLMGNVGDLACVRAYVDRWRSGP
jgi:uncharacterized protein (DUF2384 family)